MPYDVRKIGNGYYVVNIDTGKRYSNSPHKTRKEAEAQRRALYANAPVSLEKGAGFIANLFGGVRKDLSRSDKAFYNKVKNVPIISMMVVRKPIASTFGKLLNLVSLGKWNANMATQPYDRLFHLYLLMTYMDNGKVAFALTERNETIRFRSASSADFTDKPDEVMQVPYTANSLTLGTLFDNTVKNDPSIWVYSFNESNCQDYIKKLLERNNLLTTELEKFVKQDTKELVEKTLHPAVQAGLTAVTDIAAIGRKMVGMGLDNPCIHHNKLGY
jgi:hypothetical protein